MEENFSMEWKIFTMEWEWNGRFLQWNVNGMEDFYNGMEENFLYGIWKNRLPFHSIPCPVYQPHLQFCNYAKEAGETLFIVVAFVQHLKTYIRLRTK